MTATQLGLPQGAGDGKGVVNKNDPLGAASGAGHGGAGGKSGRYANNSFSQGGDEYDSDAFPQARGAPLRGDALCCAALRSAALCLRCACAVLRDAALCPALSCPVLLTHAVVRLQGLGSGGGGKYGGNGGGLLHLQASS